MNLSDLLGFQPAPPMKLIAIDADHQIGCSHPFHFAKRHYSSTIALCRYDLNHSYAARTDEYGRVRDNESLLDEYQNVSKSELIKLINEKTSIRFELGIRSETFPYGLSNIMHYAFVDCVGRPTQEEIAAMLADSLRGVYNSRPVPYAVYDSGKSYHIYLGCTLPATMWRIWMSRVANYPFIDAGWVAHSLEKGYGVLRWSASTTQKRLIRKVWDATIN